MKKIVKIWRPMEDNEEAWGNIEKYVEDKKKAW